MIKKSKAILAIVVLILLGGMTLYFLYISQKEKGRIPASKEEIFSDLVSRELKEKTMDIFKGYPFAEDIADYVITGNLFDPTSEYGRIYLKNMENLNKNSLVVYDAVKEKINILSSEDFFIRGRLLTLVNELDISADKKMEFFGEQIIRKVIFDEDGFLSEDSMNITNSMVLFKHHTQNEFDILKFAQAALLLNKEDKRAQDQLISRFKIYFPKAAKELRRSEEK